MIVSQAMLNIAEVQIRDGRDGYRWDGEYWVGGDIHRLAIKTEGEGTFGGEAGGEVQALYSRAIGPYFNLQAGVRQDLAPGADRTYASVGVEGLAPYWFDVEATAFLSDKGDLLARLEGYYDQRITQRLILQPRVEMNLSAQDVPASGLGTGVTDAEIGLRLRYEIAREFGPYVGVSWERRSATPPATRGRTATTQQVHLRRRGPRLVLGCGDHLIEGDRREAMAEGERIEHRVPPGVEAGEVGHVADIGGVPRHQRRRVEGQDQQPLPVPRRGGDRGFGFARTHPFRRQGHARQEAGAGQHAASARHSTREAVERGTDRPQRPGVDSGERQFEHAGGSDEARRGSRRGRNRASPR
ncbi:copper resistance protein B [Sphingomonas sp. MMS24-JH45]